jgi:neutral ceramidase
LQPAELAVGWGIAFEGFSRVVRDNKGGATTDFYGKYSPPDRLQYLGSHPLDAVDPQVGIVYIRGASGGPAIATLVNYAAHAVVLEHDNVRVSADYPGALAAAVVKGLAETGGGSGGECLFLQGAAGDIDPWFCLQADHPPSKSKYDPGASQRMEEMAKAISTTVLARIAAMRDFQANLPISVARTTVALPNTIALPNKLVVKQATATTLLLGPQIAVGAFPGEFFSALGSQFKRQSACPFTLFVGYTNDAIGYVPSEADWHIGAYGTIPANWCGVAKGDGERIVKAASDSLARQRTTILAQKKKK